MHCVAIYGQLSEEGLARMTMERSRSYWAGLGLQLFLLALYCGWVLSMPVFPSQDGPLHLYCVEVFRQLLAHQPGIYSQAYFVGHYLPPYSFYYYGLIVLGKVVSLEMADKLIVCLYFAVLLAGMRSLMKAVSGSADWAPLLMAPVLISWPLMMGFVNYCISIGFACFALSVWVRNRNRAGVWPRVPLLLWLVAILLTHPVPWLFVLAFCSFDLALRLGRWYKAEDRSAAHGLLENFRSDLAIVLVGCLGYFYLRQFPATVPPLDPGQPPLLHYLPQVRVDLFDYLRTHGLTVFTGTSGWPLIERLGVSLVFVAAMFYGVRFGRQAIRSRQWNWPTRWMLFAVLFTIVLPLVPPTLNGSFYFAWRLMLLLYLSVAVAASGAMARQSRGVLGLVAIAVLVSLLNLGLAFRYINPTARTIATLREAPVIHSDKPGMLMSPVGATMPSGIMYNPEYWAGALYFRTHDLLMFNTAWINLPIIPIKPRSAYLKVIDGSYYLRTPMPGNRLLANPEVARATLDRVGFVLAMHVNTPMRQSPFAEVEGSPVPGAWAAGWTCLVRQGWDLCVPPGQAIGSATR